MITIDDWTKVEVRAGKILSAEPVLGSEKLLKLSVDFGEENPRQVISGIAKNFPGGEGLTGTTCAFVVNLEPRSIMGFESQAMIMATSGKSETGEFFSLLRLSDETAPGSLVK